MAERPLPGGFVTAVVRDGDTVRRAPPPDPAFVRALLRLFERLGWDGAPRFLGTDDRGREVLSFLNGHVAWEQAQPPAVTAPASLAVLWWQDRCWRGIEARAAAGDPAMTRLRDSGAANAVRDAFGWVTQHRAGLAAPLR